eukprot:TRINITY_DN8188_c0_g2_i2.p1 TRINITY_DN8188_c0_g2~~TRINITY_DN8188_c0_g2_i2.p1  ORF type:complete len:358 (+),score=61.26 TRINITY_DN8188_c0_g2_i2:145-1218(+)
MTATDREREEREKSILDVTKEVVQAPPPVADPNQWSYATRLGLCVSGIMGFFVVYGVLQERIMTTPYGQDEDGKDIYFRDSTFLVLSNRLLACLIAVMMVLRNGESLKNVAPLHKYAGVSLSNFAATFCQYEALKYVNFPTQTLGKCGKMMPVMLVGTFLSGKKYSVKDYLIAASITLGCVVFMLTGDIATHSKDTSSTPYGLFLMAAYMFFDGFTSTFQEKMFKGYTMSTYDQMIYVNGCSALVSILVLVANGGLWSALEFTSQYPQLLVDSTMLSVCATLGQMVIYYMIKEFGALVFSTVMVTRQVVSIILSCFIYLHPLTTFQWASAALVFGTLYYKANEDRRKHGHGHGGGRH